MKIDLTKKAVQKRHEIVRSLLKDKSLSMIDIASLTGLSPRGISYINMKYGVRDNGHKIYRKFGNSFDNDIEKELKEKPDVKIECLAKKYGCSRSHIQGLIYRKNIHRVKAKSDRQKRLEVKTKEIIRLLNKNTPIEQIVEKTKTTKRFISTVASKNNLSHNVKSRRDYYLARIPLILDYIDTGLTSLQIAKMVGVSESTVARLKAKKRNGKIIYNGTTLTFTEKLYKYKTYVRVNINGSKLNYKLMPLGGPMEDAILFKYK